MCLTRERAPARASASAAGERAQPRQAEAPPPCLKGRAELDAQPTNYGRWRAAHATRTSARLTCARRGPPPPVGGLARGVHCACAWGIVMVFSWLAPFFSFFAPPCLKPELCVRLSWPSGLGDFSCKTSLYRSCTHP